VNIILAGAAKADELAGKAREPAQAVAHVLAEAGLDNPVQYAPDVVADRTGARIRIDTAFEDNVPTLTYNVAAHEFGPMIGLPDEYENPVAVQNATADNNAKAIAKTNYINLSGTPCVS